MKRLSTTALLLGVFSLFGPSMLSAQEIDATVTVNSDQLPPALIDEVTGFAEEMERYIDNTRWVDAEWEGEKVKMNFSLVFVSGSQTGSYQAKLLVGSHRNVYKSEKLSPVMMALDNDWVFRYSRNQPFQRDLSRYDDLTGLIDFYVYLALGLDLDTYDYLGGTPMYQRAWEIAQRAQVRPDINGWSTQVDQGAYSRYNIIRELTDARFNPLRKFLFDYHFNGLDLMAEKHAVGLDSLNGHLSSLVIAKDKLVQPSTIIRMLNDAKHTEYAELFKGYHDALVWRKLMYIDPGHQALYETARGR